MAGGIDWNDISSKSRGGTEILCRELEKRIDPALLERFQIIPSRVRGPLDPTRVRVLYLHDLPGDPESDKALGDGGWRKFHKIVCVSNWQMQAYGLRYEIPWDRMVVLHNCIVPIPEHEKPRDAIRLIYTSTPQRGLDLLHAVFCAIAEKTEDVHLEVFSSFELYGWDESDKQFADLFARLQEHPRITWHGARPNSEVREALQRSHVFAYPSTWTETSCLCLMEAMSAGLICVHPNNGALFETAANFTSMYQWRPDRNQHAMVFMAVLEAAIAQAREFSDATRETLLAQANYTNVFYGWDGRAVQWDALLRSLADLPTALEEGPVFRYKTG